MRRREFLQSGAAFTAVAVLPHGAFADTPFTPKPEVWRKFEITTRVELAEISERIGLAFYRFRSRSVNQRDEEVCTGEWTQIVRPRT